MRSGFALPLLLLLLASPSAAAPPSPPSPHRPTLVAGSLEPVANLVRAGADGAEWALPGGATLIAAPGSELRVIGKAQPLELAGKGRVPGFTVVLKQGFLRARIPAQAKSAIVIAAPKQTNVLVASGETSVFAGSQVAVANIAGSASVGVDGKPFRNLQAGMLEAIDDSGSKRRALLGSPKTLRGQLVTISEGTTVKLGALAWDAVPGASGYRIELRETASDRLRLRSAAQEPALPAGFAELAPGAYRVRVVSVDATGLESGSPLERSLNVVGTALPAGGYVDGSGALRVPAGSRVTLAHADELELADGLSERFAKAPNSIELPGDEPRLVRLRAQGDTAARELWLLPRRARAHVEFAPQAPRWPEQPLEIRVRIEDENGVAAPWVEARPKVRVGLDAVNVAFSAHGGYLKGTLPARSGTGPWVVRVEVSDQHGADLGRDFIEVASR
jgi:hypothetical protein